MLEKLLKIDISKFCDKAQKLIDDCTVEGLYLSSESNAIQGDFFDGQEVFSIVQVRRGGYAAYCTLCGADLCAHSSALILCFSQSRSNFETVKELELIDKLPSVSVKKAPNVKPRKPLNRKFIKMLEGVELGCQLLDEILCSGLSAADLLFQNRIKVQLNKLGGYYLNGVKEALLNGLQEISIEKPNERYLRKLSMVRRLLERGRVELENANDQNLTVMPYSFAMTKLGHVWKYDELQFWRKPVDSKLIQLNFEVSENLTAQRLEETGIWLDLLSGKIVYTQNLRPFKALKYIPSENTEYLLQKCRGLVEYPGEFNCRVKWQGSEKEEMTKPDFLQAYSLAKIFDKNEQKGLKAQMRDGISSFCPYGLYVVDQFLFGKSSISVEMNGSRFKLKDTFETNVLYTFPSEELQETACLFRFEFNFLENEIVLAPLCLVSENSINRLGF
ncbi:MAG: hypothetical protein NE327_00070 [Lentisphaeraceae bacterium]|nr:hypothetical protein [Lentisphaeraceae bacterium]